MTALAAAQSCTLVACMNPMQPSERMFTRVPAGLTLAQMLGENASHSLSVEVGGHNVPRELWNKVRPKPGQTIHATNYPQGGGNGSKYVRTALLIALTIYAPGLADSLTGTQYGAFAGANSAYVAAGIMAIGQLAITPMVGQAWEVAA